MEEYTLDYYLDHSRAAIRSIWTEDRRLSDPDGFTGDLRDQLREIDSLWIVGWGWMHYDLRADLRRWGFVETAPALDFEPFNAMPVQVWRFDRAPSGDPQVTFDGVLRLAQAEVVRRDDGITVNLLWSAARTPDRDYTVSAFVLDENGALVAQHDSYPLENRAPTSGWQADWLYFDSHPIPVGKLPPGIYRVAIKVYSFADARFEAVEIALATDCGADPACEFVIIEEITIR